MGSMPDDVPSTRGRQFPWLERLLAVRPRSTRGKRLVLAVAVCLFVGVSGWSFASLAGDVELHWWVLPVLVLVTQPLTMLANAAEFRIMGEVNGHDIAWAPAFRLTVLAAAANLMPLPGGVLVRTQALHNRGSSYRHAIAANAAAGLVWIGCAALVIAALVAAGPQPRWVPLCTAAVGALTLAAAMQVLRSVRRPEAARLLGRLLLVETGTVVVSAARVYLAFVLIGLSATVLQSTALTAAQILAAAIGIFPAGLGLREALAGLIGSVVQVGPSESVAATASDRVTGQLSLALVALTIVVATRLRGARASDVDEVAPDATSRG
jgi:uncharacterized membrane protein YbhN (UPF0104 family)